MKHQWIATRWREEEPEGGSGGNGPEGGNQDTGGDNKPLGQSSDNKPDFQATPEVFKSMLETLPDDMKAAPIVQNTKDFEGMVSQLVNQEKILGKKRIEEPQEDWTDDQWDQFYNQLGRPENPDEYFGDVDDLNKSLQEKFESKDLQLDKEELEKWSTVLHKAGVPKGKAQELLDAYVGDRLEAKKTMESQRDQTVNQFAQQLRQEWGDDYDSNLDMANQAFEQLADDSLKALVDRDKVLANNPGFLKLFQKMGSEMSGATQRTGGQSTVFTDGSPADARAQLAKLEQENQDLLFKNDNDLSMPDRARKAELLKARDKLYARAYPDE